MTENKKTKETESNTESGFVTKTKKTFGKVCDKAKNVKGKDIKNTAKTFGKKTRDNLKTGVKNLGDKAVNKTKKISEDIGATSYYNDHKDEWKSECKSFSSRLCSSFKDLRNLIGRKITADKEPTLRALNSDTKSIEEKKTILKTLFEVLRGREFIDGYHKDIIQFLDIIAEDKKLNKLFEAFLKTNAQSLYQNITKVSDKKLLKKILLSSPINKKTISHSKNQEKVREYVKSIDVELYDLFNKNFRKHYLKSFDGTISTKVKKTPKNDVIYLPGETHKSPSEND
jgi:hypothetical protein